MLFGFIWVNRWIGELANERYVSIFGFVYKEERNYFCSCLRSWTSFQSLQSVKTRDIRINYQRECVCTWQEFSVSIAVSACIWDAVYVEFSYKSESWVFIDCMRHLVLKGFSGYSLMKSLKIFQHTKIGMVEYCVVLLLIMLI